MAVEQSMRPVFLLNHPQLAHSLERKNWCAHELLLSTCSLLTVISPGTGAKPVAKLFRRRPPAPAAACAVFCCQCAVDQHGQRWIHACMLWLHHKVRTFIERFTECVAMLISAKRRSVQAPLPIFRPFITRRTKRSLQERGTLAPGSTLVSAAQLHVKIKRQRGLLTG